MGGWWQGKVVDPLLEAVADRVAMPGVEVDGQEESVAIKYDSEITMLDTRSGGDVHCLINAVRLAHPNELTVSTYLYLPDPRFPEKIEPVLHSQVTIQHPKDPEPDQPMALSGRVFHAPYGVKIEAKLTQGSSTPAEFWYRAWVSTQE